MLCHTACGVNETRWLARLPRGPSGRWAAFEVKLGQSQIDEAAATLRAFADRIDAKRCGHPAALAVITGNGYGYVRPDGVAVIPIGTLGP